MLGASAPLLFVLALAGTLACPTGSSIVALKEAAVKGKLSKIADELDAGTNINGQSDKGGPGGTALFASVVAGQEDSVRALLRRGADPELGNKDGMTPMHAAAFHNNVPVLKALVEGGASLQAPGLDGYSLLHRATWRPGKAATDGLAYLLDHLDVDSRAVAMPAEQKKKKKKKKKKKGEGVRRVAAVGSTPLMEAASRGQKYAVRLLLDRGADIHAVDADGRTALHHAIDPSGTDEVVQMLIEAGAEVGRRSSGGATPADLATQLLSGSMTAGGKLLTGVEQFPALFAAPDGKAEL